MGKGIRDISILKTIRFNLRYFGKKGVYFPVIITKNVILKNMQGKVELESYKTGNIRIGFDGTGICDVASGRMDRDSLCVGKPDLETGNETSCRIGRVI